VLRFLLCTVLSLVCSRKTVDRAYKEAVMFAQSTFYSEDDAYRVYLEEPRNSINDFIRFYNKKYKPDKQLMKEIYLQIVSN
jgi:hypothetical protein